MSSPVVVSHQPAPATMAGRAVRGAYGGVVAIVQALLHRRDVSHLLDLDDRMLKDIGLVRADVLGALAEPMSRDPSVVLRLRAVDRRAARRSLEIEVRRLTREGRATWPEEVHRA